MSSRLGVVGVVAWVVTAGALGMGCADAHRLGGDGGATDQFVMFDGDVPDFGFVDGGGVDLGPDAGRTCEGGAMRPAGGGGAPPIIVPPQSECRTSADCLGGTQCFGASDSFCGICQLPMRDCEDDTECSAGSWCRSAQPDCCGGVETTCVPDCGANGVACEEGEICDSATGRCERNGCLFLDLACPENHECDPERPDADALGCARRGCNVDSDCDCGFCVTGTCEAQLGFCSFPPA
ncbi:MAG: hypothetical protein IPI43_21990 [Sandaracinaceae bacterium]|nr:hypothetical protein [Sandaracinaceae bacterium]MBK7776769.1 hypothetical protein [Sandaracinaceae bacterium]